MMAPNVVLTGDELLRIRNKGLSVDRYADFRQMFGLGKRLATRAAAIERLTIDHFESLLKLDLRPEQIVGLAGSRLGLGLAYIIDIMHYGKVTLDEACEAYETRAPIRGSYCYLDLRFGEHKLSHSDIIRRADVAAANKTNMQRFFEFTIGVGLDDDQAVEAANSYMKSPTYVYASRYRGMTHAEIMAKSVDYGAAIAFERKMNGLAQEDTGIEMARLREQLARSTR